MDVSGRQVQSVASVRAAEERQFAIVGPDALMQRAAAGLAAAVARLRGDRDVLVVAGPGNNGGDGLFAGAILAGDGALVSVWQTSAKIHEGGLQALLEAGGRAVDAAGASALLASSPVVIDAVFGIGARGGLPGPVAAFAAACEGSGTDVVACDLPSGLDADLPAATTSFRAAVTVTFGALKPVHVLRPAASRCGEIELVDIGLEFAHPDLLTWSAADVAAVWPVPGAVSDKYARGVVGLDTGSATYPGAAVLSSLGAVYAGAGMVRHVGPPEAFAQVAAALPNVVRAAGRVQAWVVGCGWGDREDGAERLVGTLAAHVPMVVDADALRFLRPADRPDVLATPHAGELARLLGVARADIEADPVLFARRAADEFGVTVLLKGANQVVASPGQTTVLLACPGPGWTAQAGSGDTLAGICGALLAAGLDAATAAVAAASIQALTAAAHPGPYPPQDLARHLPATIAALVSPGNR